MGFYSAGDPQALAQLLVLKKICVECMWSHLFDAGIGVKISGFLIQFTQHSLFLCWEGEEAAAR